MERVFSLKIVHDEVLPNGAYADEISTGRYTATIHASPSSSIHSLVPLIENTISKVLEAPGCKITLNKLEYRGGVLDTSLATSEIVDGGTVTCYYAPQGQTKAGCLLF